MYIIPNANKVIVHFTMRQQDLLDIEDRIATKEKKFRMLERPIDIIKNLFIII